MIHDDSLFYISLHCTAWHRNAASAEHTTNSHTHTRKEGTLHYTVELFTNYVRFIALGAISVITFHCLPRSWALALGSGVRV